MTGQRGAGARVLGRGTGLRGSLLASIARNAGRTRVEKRADPAPATAPLAMQGLLPEPGLSGPMREVLLTPGADGEELGRGGRRRRMRRRIRQRVERRMERRQQREEADDGDEGLEGDDEVGRWRGRRRGRFVRADDEPDDD